MVKYGSSRALVWTIRRQITLRVFFNSKNKETWQYGLKKPKTVDFREKSLRSYMPNTKGGKKILQYNPLKIKQFEYLQSNFIIDNEIK